MIHVRDQLRLYLVTDPKLCAGLGLIQTVCRAVAGGVSMVQLRDKTASTPERTEMAIALKHALAGTGVPILINDDIDAALAADVDGAHIGQGDMPVARARLRLGRGKLLGLSCETPEAVKAADAVLIDYLGLGPVFGTATKSDHEKPIGFKGLAELAALSSLPNVAIGGLKSTHQADVRAAGADGMAVVSAICGQLDPKAAARAFQDVTPEAQA